MNNECEKSTDIYREPNLAMISLLIFMFAVVAAAVFAISLHQLRGGSA